MLTCLRNVRVEDIFLEKHASYEFITARYYEPARILSNSVRLVARECESAPPAV